MLSTLEKHVTERTKVAADLKSNKDALLRIPAVIKYDRIALEGPNELDDLVLVPDVTW
jgi:hypothetical protein